MRSGITHRWLRGSLFLTVLLVLLVESMFVYNFGRSYYNSVQQTMMRRFSSINGQLKMYTGDTAQKTAANRSVALRRMVEQFADKDKYEFMLLDGYGSVIASSSGTGADGIVVRDERSAALLAEIGVPAERVVITADPVIRMKKPDGEVGAEILRKAGVSLDGRLTVGWAVRERDTDSRFVKELLRSIQMMKDKYNAK